MSRLRLVTFILFGVLLASCASQVSVSPTAQPNAGLTPAATATETKLPATVTVSVTPTSAQTQTPRPTATANPVKVSLGQPVWAGRGQIVDAGFLPDGSGVVVGWGSGISLTDLASGKEKWFVEAPAPLINLDVQPQGNAVAAGFTDGSIMVVDIASGQSRRYAVNARPNAIWGSVAWSPDGKTVAYQFTGGNRGDPIYLLDVASGEVTQVPASAIDPGFPPRLVWSPDGKTISLPGLGTVCPSLVDVVTGETRLSLGQTVSCVPERYPPQIAAWTPDGSAVAVSQDSNVQLLSFPDGALMKTFQSNSTVAAHPFSGPALFFDPTGKWLANRSGISYYYEATEPITVWDVKRGVAIARYERPVTTYDPFYRITAAFHGNSLLMLYSDGSVTRWDFTLEKEERLLFRQTIPAAQDWTVGWSQDGKRLVYTGKSGGVYVYETASGKLVAQFPGALDSPALNADGSQAAYFNNEKNEVQVVELASEKVILRLPGATLPGGVAFSPDGSFLAYSQGQMAAVAELASGKNQYLHPSVESAPVKGQQVMHVVWSSDGSALVVAAGENTDAYVGKTALWQRDAAGTFQELTWVEDYQASYPMAVAAVFNPSGTRVVLRKEPKNEAGYIELLVYDLRQQRIIQDVKDYFPRMWVDNDILLMSQVGDFSRTTRLNVTSGKITEGRGSDQGGNVYAPGGIYFVHSDENGRGIILSDWATGAVLARGELGDDAGDLSWSPDGGWIAAVGSSGIVRVWPVSFK